MTLSRGYKHLFSNSLYHTNETLFTHWDYATISNGICPMVQGVIYLSHVGGLDNATHT